MTEEGLEGADVGAGLEQMGREGVPQRMTGDPLGDASLDGRTRTARWITLSCRW